MFVFEFLFLCGVVFVVCVMCFVGVIVLFFLGLNFIFVLVKEFVIVIIICKIKNCDGFFFIRLSVMLLFCIYVYVLLI